MKQLTEIGLTEEVVRPFARVTAHLMTQDELQGLGCDVTSVSSSDVWTFWFQNKLL
jgi:hypothetical protein